MNKSDISALIAYNFWADERILVTCEQITPEEFTQNVTPNPGWASLRGILVHGLDTEIGWRLVLQARDASDVLDEAAFPNIASLKVRWDVEKAAWLDYEAGLSAENLNEGYGDDPGNSPRVWQTIFHVINHGTQHRSEAATILTGYGRSPGELDFDLFLTEHPEYIRS